MPSNTKAKNHARASRWRWFLAPLLLVAMLPFFIREDSTPVSQPTTTLTTYDRAMQLLEEFRVEEAEVVLTTVLSRHPESVRARDELRWMYFNQFRQRELERLLEDGLRLRPRDFSLAVALLMSEFRPQNPREVLGHWERAQSQQPGQAMILATLGYCYARVGDSEKAEQAFQAALDARPNDMLVRLQTAEFLMDRGEWESAKSLLNLEYTVDGRNYIYQDRLWWNQSLLAESQGDLDGALKQIDRSLERQPNELRYVQRRGTLMKLLGHGDKADACFSYANQLESYVGRLTEIVLSGDLEDPSPELCREIAEICQQRGKLVQSATWKHAAVHLERRNEK